MKRRRFVVIGISALTVACADWFRKTPSAPSSQGTTPAPQPQPQPQTISLLIAVRQAGYSSAQSIAYGTNGAARIAIGGSVNYNFLVNGQLVGIGSGQSPTLNVPAMQVSNNAQITVRGI